ncbi:MAG: hypothetical protein JST02_05775 [Bacteroidetes bacterium]|nr:hypothetical protein [Bacteroidota bacterium]
MSKEYYITSSCTISNNSIHKNGVLLFEEKGKELNNFLISAYKNMGLNYPKFYKMDNLSRLGWLGTELLLKDSFNKDSYRPEETGIVLSNRNSSFDTDTRYFETTRAIPSPALFVYTLPNIVIGEISIRHNFKGEHAFFIFEDFDAAFIQEYVEGLLNNSILEACICGWVEVLGNEYKAFLLLVEKKGSMAFTTENIHKIYYQNNG